jgi:single-strand DNA-binding protein
MARGLNHVYLMGALTKDPEMRYTPSGIAVADMTVAGEDNVLGNDGKARVLPWYHRISILGQQAERISDSLKQGDPVLVEGSLEFRSWETPEGQKRSAVSVKALRVEAAQFGTRAEPLVTDSVGGKRLTNALNEVVLVGNMTRDAELRYTPSGDAVTTISIAVNESWKDKTGNWQEKTHYVEVNLWRDLAEAAGELKKGDPVMIMGRLVNESWTDREGNKRSTTRVEGRRIEILARGPGTAGSSTTTSSANRQAGGYASAQPSVAGSRAKPDIDDGLHDFPPEEDLPF